MYATYHVHFARGSLVLYICLDVGRHSLLVGGLSFVAPQNSPSLSMDILPGCVNSIR